MDLFSKKKQEEKEEEIPKPTREIEPVGEPLQIDEEDARIRFRIYVRELYEIETQIKSGKFMEVDRLRRDKIPTMNRMINMADNIKLQIMSLINGFKDIGYTDADINSLKNEALESRKGYVFYTT